MQITEACSSSFKRKISLWTGCQVSHRINKEATEMKVAFWGAERRAKAMPQQLSGSCTAAQFHSHGYRGLTLSSTATAASNFSRSCLWVCSPPDVSCACTVGVEAYSWLIVDHVCTAGIFRSWAAKKTDMQYKVPFKGWWFNITYNSLESTGSPRTSSLVSVSSPTNNSTKWGCREKERERPPNQHLTLNR